MNGLEEGKEEAKEVIIMPKRKGTLRKDEVIETNLDTGKQKIKRLKKFKLPTLEFK